jgi:hypothetical protein
LKLIPRADFDSAVHKHAAERNAKKFSCWGQFVAMLFCRLGSVNILRDITSGLACLPHPSALPCGYPPFYPRMMTKVLVYGHCDLAAAKRIP